MATLLILDDLADSARLIRRILSAQGHDAVCAIVNDSLDRPVLASLAADGVTLVALRSAGFNHVDVGAAREFGLAVVRVPEYSPHSVAEHTVGLILALDRRIHRAHARVREGNFALDGLLGRELRSRTAGVVGTGRIGAAVARILRGFGRRPRLSRPPPQWGAGARRRCRRFPRSRKPLAGTCCATATGCKVPTAPGPRVNRVPVLTAYRKKTPLLEKSGVLAFKQHICGHSF